MQITSPPRWFRIVSIAMAVLPVERSPMMSSRWPRPIGIIESIAFSPVWSGSFTDCRLMTPGALNSRGRRSLVSIGPRPSSGSPSGSTTRPRSASPTGTLMTSPVRRTGSPSLTCSHSPKSAAPTLSSSRLNAIPTTPCSSSSRSSATQFSRPWIRAMPSPTWRTVPTSERSVSTSNSLMRSLRIAVISSGRSFTSSPCVGARLASSSSCGCQFLTEPLEPATDAAVGAERSDLENDPADQAGIDGARRLDDPAGGVLNLVDDGTGLVLGELVGGRELEGEAILLARDESLELGAHLGELAGAALLGDEPDEVADELVAVGGELVEEGGLFPRVDLGIAEERAQLRNVVQRARELAEVCCDLLEPPLLPSGLEERSGVHPLRDRHGLHGLLLERGEVELGDRLVDQTPLVVGVEDLAGDARGRREGQLGDLAPDLVERALRLRVDLTAVAL